MFRLLFDSTLIENKKLIYSLAWFHIPRTLLRLLWPSFQKKSMSYSSWKWRGAAEKCLRPTAFRVKMAKTTVFCITPWIVNKLRCHCHQVWANQLKRLLFSLTATAFSIHQQQRALNKILMLVKTWRVLASTAQQFLKIMHLDLKSVVRLTVTKLVQRNVNTRIREDFYGRPNKK